MKKLNFKLLWLLCALFVYNSSTDAQTDVSSSYSWNEIKIGGAGFVTGISISNSGNTIVNRTDVGGGYLWNAAENKWEQLVTAERLGYSDPNVVARDHTGVEGIAVAPTDDNKLYMAYGTSNGYLYYSNNRGDSWQRSSFPATRMDPNGSERLLGDRLIVDPFNKNVAYFASRESGLLKTTNGGADWTQISTSQLPVGDGDVGITNIDCDPAGGTLSNPTRAKHLMATVHGDGVHESNDGGNTWNKIKSNLRMSDATFGIDGTYYMTLESTENQVWKYNSGTWTNISPASKRWQGVVCDPNDANKLFVVENGLRIWISTDKGNSWSNALTRKRYSPTIPWAEDLTDSYIAYGDAVFDPNVNGKLWITEGFGALIENNIYDSNVAEFYVISMGMEEGVASSIAKPSGWGNSIITTSWDYAINYNYNMDEYPLKEHHEIPNATFGAAWEIDYCYNNPNNMVANVQWQNDAPRSGYSTDGGLSWTMFSAQPPVGSTSGGAPRNKELCGDIAVARNDLNKIVWAKNWNLPVYYSNDRGASWHEINLPGQSTGALNNEYNYGDFVVADPNANNTFYIYHFNSGGFYKSTDGGVNWTKLSDLPFKAWHFSVKVVPGHSGHIFYCGAYSFGSKKLMRSTDGGVNWTEFSNTDNVQKVALGKEKSGTNYPAIYIIGEVNGDYGYWRSTDEGSSWEKIAKYPKGLFKSNANAFEADPDVYGKVYAGYGGLGFVYGQISGTTPGDTEKPTAPSGLNASGISQTSCTLSWNASSDNIGVTGYDIYQNGSKIGSVDGSTTTYDVQELTCATTYNFYVKAKDAAGNISLASNTKNVTPANCSGGGQTYRYLKLDVTQVNGSRLRLSEVEYKSNGVFYPTQNMTDFTAPAPLAVTSSNDLNWENAWKLYDGDKSNEAFNLGLTTYWNTIDLGAGNEIAPEQVIFTHGAVDSKYPVDFTIQGSNDGAAWTTLLSITGESGWTPYSTHTFNIGSQPPVDIEAPSIPNGLSASNITDESFTLSWNASNDNVGVIGYDIFKDGSYIGSSTNTSFSVSGLSCGSTNNYKVKAKDAAGNISAASSALPVTTSSCVTMYRYFKFDVTQTDGSRLRLSEIEYKSNGTAYPVQNMTGFDAPSPLVATSSHNLNWEGAWKLYDGVTSVEAFNLGLSTYWNQIDLGAGNEIALDEVVITHGAVNSKYPVDFTIEGSNDGSTWTTIFEITGESGWTAFSTHAFSSSSLKVAHSDVSLAHAETDDFKVYPNPAKVSNIITVEYNSEKQATLSITNLAGCKMFETTTNSTGMMAIDKKLEPGIYLIILSNEEEFLTKKLLVQ